MSFRRSLLRFSYHPILIGKYLYKNFNPNRGFRLRVLLYHDISPRYIGNFDKQIKWLSSRWKFITPEEFSKIIDGKSTLEADSLLITFDDGFLSNYYVAKQVLSKYGIKAIFFVISDFLVLNNKRASKNFISQHIYPEYPVGNLPVHWENMSLSMVKELLEMGHEIGSHTITHAKLSKLDPISLGSEIKRSKDNLELMLNCQIKHFAYTFGDIESFSEEALKLSISQYKYIHTGLGGVNTLNPYLINRDSIYDLDPPSLIGAILEGGGDVYFTKSIRKYMKWLKNIVL